MRRPGIWRAAISRALADIAVVTLSNRTARKA